MNAGAIRRVLYSTQPRDSPGRLLAGVVLAFSVAWLVADIAIPSLLIQFFAPPVKIVIESLVVAGCFFGGFAMYLFPVDRPRSRLRWLTTGLFVMATASLIFAILPALFLRGVDLNQSAWTWFSIRIVALSIFAAGMLPRVALDVSAKTLVLTGAAAIILIGLVYFGSDRLPRLLIVDETPPISHVSSAELAADPPDKFRPGPPSPGPPPPKGLPRPPGPPPRGVPPIIGPTPLHLVLSGVAAILSLAVVAGTVIRSLGRRFDRWLIGAFSLLAAAQLWGMLVPSAFTPVVSPTDLFRLAFAVSISFAGLVEIRRLAEERATMSVLGAVTAGKLTVTSFNDLHEEIGRSVAAEFVISKGEDLERGRHYLREVLATEFPDFSESGRLVVGAGEALSNALKHAGSGAVQVFRKDGLIQIMISDSGPGIDFSVLPKAVLVAGYSEKKSLGMGFEVMLDAADRVLLSTGPDGTTVVLEKREMT